MTWLDAHMSCVNSSICVTKLQVSFAKEPYERDDILQKRPKFCVNSSIGVIRPIQCVVLKCVVLTWHSQAVLCVKGVAVLLQCCCSAIIRPNPQPRACIASLSVLQGVTWRAVLLQYCCTHTLGLEVQITSMSSFRSREVEERQDMGWLRLAGSFKL